MRAIIVLVFYFFAPQFIWTQSTAQFTGEAESIKLLEVSYLKCFNAFRKEKGLTLLKTDRVLNNAAVDQAEYQAQVKDVTHDQKQYNKKSPTDRVAFYGGTHAGVGENCLSSFIKNQSGEWYSIDELAKKILDQWINSPPHFVNMITTEYTLTGLGFKVNSETGLVYATQVFAEYVFTKPFENYPRIVNSFGVLNDPAYKCNYPPQDEFLVVAMANYLVIENDSIFIYYRDIARIKKLITGPNDGIAIDIVLRSQMVCNGPNNFYNSDVHDGIMLQPVYRDELFRRNKKIKGRENELIAFIGTIPEEVRRKEYSVSTIVIKDKHICRYSTPVTIPEGTLFLKDMKTKWVGVNTAIKPGSYKEEFKFKVPFEQGEAKFNQADLKRALTQIEGLKPYVKKITIQSFASVEGDKTVNEKLQFKRAKEIKDVLLPYTTKGTEIVLEGKINYDLLRKQVVKTKLAYVERLTDVQIQEKVKQPKFLDSIAKFLPQQRVALLNVQVEVTYDDKTLEKYLHLGLFHRMKTGDTTEAGRIYAKLYAAYSKDKIDAQELCKHKVPLDRRNVNLLANYIGALFVADSIVYSKPRNIYLRKAFEMGNASLPLAYNMLLYNIDFWSIHDTSLLSFTEMESIVDRVYKSNWPDDIKYDLLYNYYLLAIEHYDDNRLEEKLEPALLRIKNRMTQKQMSTDELLDFVKYLNGFYKLKWTTELTKPYALQDRPNEDVLFFFLETATLYRKAVSNEEYKTLLKKAPIINKVRFCNWLNDDNFQQLRNEEVKKEFCKYCADMKFK